MRKIATLLGTAFLLTACVARPIEVGSPPPADGADDPRLEGWPSSSACAAQSNLGMQGVWNGYFGRFQNPTPDFRIDIRGASVAGGLCGTVTFDPGRAPPPAPTGPAAMYPASPDYESLPRGGTFSPPLISGVKHIILDGRAQGSRAEIPISRNQAWQRWCELQSTYADEVNAGHYNCLPNTSFVASDLSDPYTGTGCFLIDPHTSEQVLVSCGQLFLCRSHVCSCDAERCVANQAAYDGFGLDFTADEATGQLSTRGEVLLERVR